jgi:DNA adenine methylase
MVGDVRSLAGTLAAPFPYFGGKALACEPVWAAFGDVDNYVEPFAGSAAMLLGAPDGKRVETINDADGFVANFWRATANDCEAVAAHADWPCNETDLFARHSWLMRQRDGMLDRLHADPDWYDAKIAGWWCWGACNWIGSGWCSGTGPWVHDGERIVDSRQLPHLSAGQGINRQLPHLSAGQGINRKLPHLGDAGRGAYIREWFSHLGARLRDVRVTCGDWRRVLTDSVTTRHGVTGVFLDPPYTKGSMDYGAGGMGLGIADDVRSWCLHNGDIKELRIVLCGHAGEHDSLLQAGWLTREWTARKGYAMTEEAVQNSASETLWCSPHCFGPETPAIGDLFADMGAA